MKKLLFCILTISIPTVFSFGQDAEDAFKNARKAFNQAATLESEKRTEKLKEASEQIDIATAAIDKFDDKELVKVWLLNSEIYTELAKTDLALFSLSGGDYTYKFPQAPSKAYQGYIQALNTPDLKKFNKTSALDGLRTISSMMINDGVTAFTNQDYNKAYDSFKSVSKIESLLIENKHNNLFDTPEKKNDHLYTEGMAAFMAEKYPEAETLFKELINNKFDNPAVYDGLIKIYLQNKKESEALALLEKAREAYPEDEMLRVTEINYYLQAEKLDELTGKLEDAIKADPTNVTLYATLGHVYDNLSQREYTEGNEEKGDEYFSLALRYYENALKIDDKHFNTLYNLGALYYNKAAQVTRELAGLDEDYSTAGLRKAEAKRGEMMQLFDKALPFFQRAEALDPDDLGTLSALQEIYARKDNLELVNEFKTRMEKSQSGEKNKKSYFDN